MDGIIHTIICVFVCYDSYLVVCNIMTILDPSGIITSLATPNVADYQWITNGLHKS